MRVTAPGRIRLAADAHLFLLGDEGVFFCAGRQEIHLFNTAAAWIWCALEEGLDRAAIEAGFAAGFGLDAAEARRIVGEQLLAWQRAGLLAGVPWPGGEIDFPAALGRLLSNALLREDFARDPAGLARGFRLRAADVAPFVALDPAELEHQALGLLEKPLARRRAAAQARHAAAEYAYAGRAVPPFTEGETLPCRLLGTGFLVRVASGLPAAAILAPLLHLRAETGRDSVRLDVVEEGGAVVLCEDGQPVRHCARPDGIVPLLKAAMRRIATDRHGFLLELHAGVVGNGEVCLLLPAAPGNGKTTLTAGLVADGCRYLSDEIALVEEPGFAVRAAPLALTVKPGAAEILAPLFPGVLDLPVHRREDGAAVRYLPPPPGSVADGPAPVCGLVFPRYVAGARTELRPLEKGEALRRCLKECMVLPSRLERAGVEAFVRWFRGLSCHELTMGPLPEAVALVRGLMPR